MKLKVASKQKVKMKLAINGCAGSGKTMSALTIARGLTGDYGLCAVLDCENSAELYSDLGPYNVLRIEPPFSPDKYIRALKVCIDAGMQCVIIDGISPCWEYLLDYHASLPGNGFSNWKLVNPLHQSLMDAIMQADVHIICTVRSKQEYVLTDKGNGKLIPEKVSMKPIQRDQVEFLFTLVLDMDISHRATATKDRTGLFMGVSPFVPTEEVGRSILSWCNTGSDVAMPPTFEDVLQAIHECTTIAELSELYYRFPQYQEVLRKEYASRKETIIANIKQQTAEHGTAAVNQ